MKSFYSYIKYLRSVRLHFVIALVCGLIYGVASGFGIPFMMNEIFPRLFAEGEEQLSWLALFGWAAFIPGVMLIRGTFGFINTYLISFCGVRVLEAIRVDLFRKFQALPLAYFERRASGDLVSRSLSDTNTLQTTITGVANDAVKQPITLLAAVGALIYLALQNEEVIFILLCLAVVPVCVFPILSIGKKLLKRSRQTQRQMGGVTDFLSQNLRAVREVRAYNQEEKQTEEFQNLISRLFRVQMKSVKYGKILNPIIEVISSIGIALAFVYAYRKGVTLEVFIPLIGALFLSYEPIKKIGAIQNQLQKGRGALERLDEVLKEPIAVEDPPWPVKIGQFKGKITFSDVSFAYAEQSVLENISVSIAAGEVCALVGPSGAGKTTFTNLIARFYDATSGSVTVDDIDIRDMRQGDLRKNIALVSQAPFLFHDTAYNNILIGNPQAPPQEVYTAARQSHAHEFICALPNGYETSLAEDAVSLSGGQKQRIALARAFLKDAPILILDEATSALDSESEAKVREALENLMRNKTVLIIAHRFSTISHADRILVFQAGRIVASGTHEQLCAESPLYESLYRRQTVGAKTLKEV
ncbi:MAG: ABC transporter ATP-binding protein [Opitutales bacterium]